MQSFHDHSRIVVDAHLCVMTTEPVFDFQSFSKTYGEIKTRLERATHDDVHFNWRVDHVRAGCGYQVKCTMALHEHTIEELAHCGGWDL